MVSGGNIVTDPGFRFKGRVLPFMKLELQRIEWDDNGVANMFGAFNWAKVDEDTVIPRRAGQPLLVLCAADDMNLPAERWARLLSGGAQVHVYPSAGHLHLEPPSPHCSVGWSPPLQSLMWFGGQKDLVGAAKSKLRAWKDHQQWLKMFTIRGKL